MNSDAGFIFVVGIPLILMRDRARTLFYLKDCFGLRVVTVFEKL